jgi:hypothetical protein
MEVAYAGAKYISSKIYFSNPYIRPFLCIHFLLNLIHLGNIKTLKIYSIDIHWMSGNVYQTNRLRVFFLWTYFQLHEGRFIAHSIDRGYFFRQSPVLFFINQTTYLFSIFFVSLLSQSKNTWTSGKHFSDDLLNYFNENEEKKSAKHVWWRR